MSGFTEQLLALQQGHIDERNKFENLSPVKYKQNVLYVVSAVLIKEDHILLVSEAKQDCYGQWYLPAGKVKRNESLRDAFFRELKEESCLEGEVDHLLSINARPRWFRFNFLGHQTGGHVKTYEERDEESLQAQWFPIDIVLSDKLNLRHGDIIDVVRDAVSWLSNEKSIIHERSSVIKVSHTYLLQRLLVVHQNGNRLEILVDVHQKIYPVSVFRFSAEWQVEKLFGSKSAVDILGFLAVEHFPADAKKEAELELSGICFNILCEMADRETAPCDPNFEWVTINDENLLVAFQKIKSSNSFIKMK